LILAQETIFGIDTTWSQTVPKQCHQCPVQPSRVEDSQLLLYPGPINDLTTGNQVNVMHSYTNSGQRDLKIDWIASQKDHIYARYSQQHIINSTIGTTFGFVTAQGERPLQFALRYLSEPHRTATKLGSTQSTSCLLPCRLKPQA
jgi:hypothetical protein